MQTNTTSDIEAEELTLKKVFSEDYFYKTPEFQRPFSWEKENFEQLIEELKDYDDWNMHNLEKRHYELIDEQKNFGFSCRNQVYVGK